MKLLLVSALASTSLFIGSLSADPYTVIRTITHSENALWNTAGGDLKPIVALDPDYFVIATKGRRLSGGAAYVFDASDGAFLRRLTASDAGEGMEFGAALAVDGGFALVGAPNKFISASNRGKAYLYNLATGAEILTFNQTDGFPNDPDLFGTSVALDGTVAVVGAPRAGDSSAVPTQYARGFVYVFDTSTGALERTFTASDPEAGAQVGESVAVKGDDVLAGAPFATNGAFFDAGKAYVFDRATGAERFILLAPDPANEDYFGMKVSISDTYFVVAATSDDDGGGGSGSIYLFNRSDGAFVRKFGGNPTGSGAAFGWNHSASGDAILSNQTFEGTSFGFYDLATGTRTELISDFPTIFGHSSWRGNTLIVGRGTSTSDGFTLADGNFTIQVLSDGSAPVPAKAPSVKPLGKRKINLKRPKLTLRGTASDPDGDLALIEVKVGNKPFTPASGTDNWSVSVKGLKPGKNTLQIRSKDAAGNTSAVVKLTVVLK